MLFLVSTKQKNIVFMIHDIDPNGFLARTPTTAILEKCDVVWGNIDADFQHLEHSIPANESAYLVTNWIFGQINGTKISSKDLPQEKILCM